MRNAIIVMLVVALSAWAAVTLAPHNCEECHDVEVSRLVDFDLNWYNTYDRPVDQISIEIKQTGQVFAADVVYDPYVRPQTNGLFSVPLERELYEQAVKGFRVINVRTR